MVHLHMQIPIRNYMSVLLNFICLSVIRILPIHEIEMDGLTGLTGYAVLLIGMYVTVVYRERIGMSN